MTHDEMAKAYPALCQKCDDLQSDLEATRDCVQKLKDDKEKLQRDLQNAERIIMSLKAKLYDMTSANWL